MVNIPSEKRLIFLVGTVVLSKLVTGQSAGSGPPSRVVHLFQALRWTDTVGLLKEVSRANVGRIVCNNLAPPCS
jgi:hypothetical protein